MAQIHQAITILSPTLTALHPPKLSCPPDHFQATGCTIPVEYGQQGFVLGQLQGLAVALGSRLVVLALKMLVPFLLQLCRFCLCHLWEHRQPCVVSLLLDTQGKNLGLLARAPGFPLHSVQWYSAWEVFTLAPPNPVTPPIQVHWYLLALDPH